MRDGRSKKDREIRGLIQEALGGGPQEVPEHPSEQALTSFLDGTLAEPERSDVERHLASCASCAETLLLAVRAGVSRPPAAPSFRGWRQAASWLLVAGTLFAAVSMGRVAGNQVESLALDRMDGMLGGRVSAGSVRLAFEDGPVLKITDLRLELFEGQPPTVIAPSAVLRPVLSSLTNGQFQASLALASATITVAEVAPGRYTIDPVLPGARSPKALRDAAWYNGVSSVSLEGVTIRYLGGHDGMSFVLDNVEGRIEALKGPGPVRLQAQGSSARGGFPFRVEAEVNFPPAGPPAYSFGAVEIGGLPIELLGFAGEMVTGRMSFVGKLSATGLNFRSLTESLAGAGRVEVGRGSFPDFSVAKRLVASMRTRPAVAPNREWDSELARSETRFRSLGVDLRLAGKELRGANLRIEGENFELRGAGKVTGGRKLDAAGRVLFNPGASRYLAKSIRGTRSWLKSPDQMEVPFIGSGTLPDVRLEARKVLATPEPPTPGPAAPESAESEPVAAEPAAAPPAFIPAENGLGKASDEASRGFAQQSTMPPGLQQLSLHLAAGGLADPQSVHAALGTFSKSEVLLTGYYEPTLEGRRRRSDRFRYPIYGVPGDPTLRRKSRREIDAGALQGLGLELFWSDDLVEIFFLQIQGSGRLRLADGTIVRLGYAAHNDEDYRSIGRILVGRGDLTVEEATAPGIRSWLAAHPDDVRSILHENPRYIYFRQTGVDPTMGPTGSLGVPLVPWHSVAVDPSIYPPGSVGRLRGVLPDGRVLDTVVIAMDSGAAIAGPGRMDLFVGEGAEAGALAGRMRSRATVDWLGPSSGPVDKTAP